MGVPSPGQSLLPRKDEQLIQYWEGFPVRPTRYEEGLLGLPGLIA
jgi:hypothetical protein